MTAVLTITTRRPSCDAILAVELRQPTTRSVRSQFTSSALHRADDNVRFLGDSLRASRSCSRASGIPFHRHHMSCRFRCRHRQMSMICRPVPCPYRSHRSVAIVDSACSSWPCCRSFPTRELEEWHSRRYVRRHDYDPASGCSSTAAVRTWFATMRSPSVRGAPSAKRNLRNIGVLAS